jgi:hypothetical protein
LGRNHLDEVAEEALDLEGGNEMIIKRFWRKYNRKCTKHSDRMGYFLFGLIPLYVEMYPWTV